MDGIFGWLGNHGIHQDLIRLMAEAAHPSPESQLQEYSDHLFGVAGHSRLGKAGIHVESSLAGALYGRPRFIDEELARIARDQGAIDFGVHESPNQFMNCSSKIRLFTCI